MRSIQRQRCSAHDEILAIDANLLKVRNRWPINPVDGPSGLVLDKAHHRLFAVGGNELMAVVDTLTGKLVATPPIGKGPDAVAFDPSLGLAISSNGQDGTLTLVGEDSKKMLTALGTVPNIRYVDMPEAIRDSYQYFTQSDADRLRRAGYNGGFTALEDAVGIYVKGFLDRADRFR